jgi:hypothetical protein
VTDSVSYFDVDAMKADQQRALVSGLTPDENVEALRYAGSRGVPTQAVIGNPDMRTRIQPPENPMEGRPELLDTFGNEADFAAVFYEDLPFLAKVQDTLKNVPVWAEKGVGETDLSLLYADKLFGGEVDADIEQARFDQGLAMRRAGPMAEVEGGLGRYMLRSAVELLPPFIEQGKGALAGAGAGAAAGAGVALVAGQAGPQAALPEEIVTVPAAAAIGGGKGAFAGSLFQSVRLNGGSAYQEFLDDPSIPEDAARGAAFFAGLTMAGLDAFGFSKLVKTIPGAERIAAIGGKDQIKAALKNRSFQVSMAKIGQRLVAGVTAETFTEAAQEAVQIIAGDMAQIEADDSFDVFKPESLQRLADVAQKTAAGVGLLGGGMATVETGVAAKKAGNWKRDPEAVKQHMAGVIESIKETPRASKAPEQLRKFIGKVTSGEKIWVDGAKAQELYQSVPETQKALIDAALPRLAGDLDDAAAAGVDIEMDAADFYSYFAPVDGAERLADFAKLDMDSQSWYETQANQEVTDELADFLEAAAQGLTETEQVQKRIEGLLLDTGRFTVETASNSAAQMAAVFDATMQRYGNTPEAAEIIQRAIGELAVEYKDALRQSVDQVDFEIDRLRQVVRKRRIGAKRPAGEVDMLGTSRVPRQIDRSPKPLMRYLEAMGGVKRGGKAAAELEALGITPKTHPRLFRKTGRDSLDNIPLVELQAEFPEVRADAISGNYADPDWWHATLAEEARGRGQMTADQQAARDAEAMDAELIAALESRGIDLETATNSEIKAVWDALQTGQLFQGMEEGANGTPYEGDMIEIDGVARQATNSSGQRIARSEEGLRNFWAWFGNSKVVDAEGKPLVVYHGTDAEFEAFDLGVKRQRGRMKPSDLGVWFVGSKDYASNHGERLVEAYLSIRNPKVYTRERWAESWDKNTDFEALKKKLEADGHDGVLIRSGYIEFAGQKIEQPAMQVAFSPTQIKSVFNRGTFDPNDARILYQSDNINAPVSIADGVEFDPSRSFRDNLNSIPDEIFSDVEFDMYDAADAYIAKVKLALSAALDRAGYEIDSEDKSSQSQSVYWNVKRKNDADGENIVKVRFSDHGETKSAEGSDAYAFWGESLDEIFASFAKAAGIDATLFQRTGKERGSIQFAQGMAKITLSANANLSTFLHESGHLYVQLLRELAQVDEAARKDFDILKKAVGSEADAFTVPQEEKLAEMFEDYLMRGKAPSMELHGAFRRFKAWMLRVYSTVKFSGAKVTPEVADVFDRLLATDEQIEQMKRAISFKPDAAVMEMMTEDQRRRYVKMKAREVEAAKERLLKKAMREVSRKEKDWYKAQRERVRDEMRTIVENAPVYRLLDAISRGDMKISRAMFKDHYGEGAMAHYPRKAFASEGLPPDTVAEMFGFQDALAMNLAVANAATKKAEIERLTDQEMISRFGDMILDGSIEREALESMHNGDRSETLYLEAITVAERAKQRAFARQAIAQAAKDKVGATPVGRLDPYLYYRGEVRAARDFARHMRANAFEKAAEAKRRELLNHYLFKESAAAQRRVDRDVKRFKKLNRVDRKVAKTVDIDFANAARAVLARYGIGSIRFDVRQWLDRLRDEDAGTYQTLSSFVAATIAEPRNYRDLTVDEFVSLRDAVDNVLEAGETRRALQIGEAKLNRDELMAGMIASLEKFSRDKPTDGAIQDKSKIDKAISKVADFVWKSSRFEHVANMLDGREGQWTQLFRMVKKAETDYAIERDMYYGRLRDLLKPHAKRLHAGKIVAPELGKTADGANFTFENKAQLLGALLHTGNLSSLEKLVRGRKFNPSGWARFTLRAMQEGIILKEDMDIVQAMWDMAEEVKPRAQSTFKQLFGHRFEEVKAIPVWTPWGYYRGGYWPATVDSSLNPDAQRRADQAELDQSEISFMLPSAEKGFTQSRKEKYAAPLTFDLGLAMRHMDDVLKFIHLTPMVRLMNSIALNKEFRTAVDAVFPGLVSNLFIPYIKRVSSQRVVDMTPTLLSALYPLFSRLRFAASLQTVALNLVNSIQNLSGLPQAVQMVGMKPLLQSLSSFGANPFAMQRMKRMIDGKSDYMRSQVAYVFAERANQEYDRIIKAPRFFSKQADWVRSNAYILDHMTSIIVAYSTWLASYRNVIADPRHVDMDSDALERMAVETADSNVRFVIAKGDPSDVSAIEAGSPAYRMFTMFSNFFNNHANYLGTNTLRILRGSDEKSRQVGRLFYLWMMSFFLTNMLATAIYQWGYGVEDEDDDGDTLDDALYGQMLAVPQGIFSRVPLFGQIGYGLMNAFDDKPYNDRLQLSPVIGMTERALKAPAVVYDAFTDDGDMSRATREALTAAGFVFALPLGKIAAPVSFAADVIEGESNPRQMTEWKHGLLAGRMQE